ncbi:MAG: hypothetical protein K1X65_12595 [Caldilineales bacterium]|nr:hypothetical protein [Caldilineales bacterium]
MAPTITVGLDELELVVRRALRKELAQFVTQRRTSILHDWDQEGPEDDVADEALAAEALAILERYRKDRTGWQKWEDFEAELDAAEAAGELPN